MFYYHENVEHYQKVKSSVSPSKNSRMLKNVRTSLMRAGRLQKWENLKALHILFLSWDQVQNYPLNLTPQGHQQKRIMKRTLTQIRCNWYVTYLSSITLFFKAGPTTKKIARHRIYMYKNTDLNIGFLSHFIYNNWTLSSQIGIQQHDRILNLPARERIQNL